MSGSLRIGAPLPGGRSSPAPAPGPTAFGWRCGGDVQDADMACTRHRNWVGRRIGLLSASQRRVSGSGGTSGTPQDRPVERWSCHAAS